MASLLSHASGGLGTTGGAVTVGASLAANSRPSGFDYLRIILAYLIMVDHSLIVTEGFPTQLAMFSGWMRSFTASLIPMFFALSGFLVAMSLVRSKSLTTFVGLRILRIVPALAVDTIFCALVLGVLLTTVPLREYFTSRDFVHYFLNIIGLIHYRLPGVFTTMPVPKVNAQLWTIPNELYCYIILTLLGLVGLHRRRGLFLIAVITAMAAHMLYVVYDPPEVVDLWQLLLPSFLFGVAFYLYQDVVLRDWRLFMLSAVAQALLLQRHDWTMVFAAIPVAYNTIYLGLTDFKRINLIRSGDYSYPLYLYSFPIQQAVGFLLPTVGMIWWMNLILSTPLSLALAMFSWHLVEKPSQRQRRYLYAFEDWLGARTVGARVPIRR